MYDNAFDMELAPKNIFSASPENKSKPGGWVRGRGFPHMLTNKLTDDIYIGQSIDISKRFKNYFNTGDLKTKQSLIISRVARERNYAKLALIKYGYSNFF